MRKVVWLAIVLAIVACSRDDELLKALPKIPRARLKEIHKVQGVPVAEYSVNSEDLMKVVRQFDSVLTGKWNRISVDTTGLRLCMENKQANTMCGGSVSWLVLNTPYQITMTIVGFANASEGTLDFNEFAASPK